MRMYEKDRQRKEVGITLVALVVTIVVLLILAGITLNLLFSDNGIIQQAQKAENKTNEANKKEEEDLKNAEDVLNHYNNGIVNEGGNTPEPGPLPSDGSYSEEKKVNTPKLGEGMTAIKWDATAKDGAGDWIETTGDDKDWYSYTETDKKWANAKTEDGSMWVWIPRYAYQIESGWHQSGADINNNNGNNSAGKINIKFLKGTTDTASDGTNKWDNASGQGNWNIHPAFSYGSEVSGIWVAKFEASQSDAGANSAGYGTPASSGGTSGVIKIQAGVNSWRNISINDIYNYCKSYNSTLNSHMMKNSEWGAVAYLAQSVYGKNSEVWINPNRNHITGQAGKSISASGTTSTYAYNDITYGLNASTTGNIYGIYDMSGGTSEFTAAYVNNGNSYLTTYGVSLVSGNAKTKDVYSMGNSDNQSNNYTANSGKYGDAVYETSSTYNSANGSWYGDYMYFPRMNVPFFLRGGAYSEGSFAGLFYLCYESGNASTGFSFRPVLCVM